MPGQTTAAHRAARGRDHGFNGGPGNCPAKLPRAVACLEPRCAASMEGRAIARPNMPDLSDVDPRIGASMEGRAIARPNSTRSRSQAPAKIRLQWRAGQLPGQTRRVDGVVEHGAGQASMEGRAIARPNKSSIMSPFEPARQLQWRAGQLPGQTRLSVSTTYGKTI